MRTIVLFAMSLWPALGASAADADVERRIGELVARMTLQEKLGQMSQSTSLRTPLSDAIKAEIRAGRWGSFLNAGDARDRAEAQRIATEESRLKIPLIFGRDVIHGYQTVFPIPLGQAATWDPDLVRQAAREAAREAAADRITWTFAPMIDIARDPRWGRIAESLGEDPYLASQLGAAMIRGFQGDSLAAPDSLAACAKHYAGYGAAEGGRDYNSAWLPEILLRDVYLRPFQAASQAGVATFMTAFNTLNAVPATADSFLLRNILRGEWKYEGMVVSDYEAVTNLIAHGYALDAREAARKAIRAGVEMEMVSTSFYDHAAELLRAGQITMQDIDGSVRDILRLKFRLGLFDPRPVPPPPDPQRTLAVAEKTAEESAVLLRNEGRLLPLSKSIRKIAVIGPLADSPVDQMGTWSMDGRADFVRTPLAALREMLGAGRVIYAPGLINSRDRSRAGFDRAVSAARQADAAVLFLGEEAILSGEARSRAFLNLPGAQEALVDAVAAAGKPIAAVILAGRPLTFHDAAAKIPAILYCFHPGTMGGPAIARLLFGDASPSGKTAGDLSPHRRPGADLLRASQHRAPAACGRPRRADGQSGESARLPVKIHRRRLHSGVSVRLRPLLHELPLFPAGALCEDAGGRRPAHHHRAGRQHRPPRLGRDRAALHQRTARRKRRAPGPRIEGIPARPSRTRRGRPGQVHHHHRRSGLLQPEDAARRRARALSRLDRAGFGQRSGRVFRSDKIRKSTADAQFRNSPVDRRDSPGPAPHDRRRGAGIHRVADQDEGRRPPDRGLPFAPHPHERAARSANRRGAARRGCGTQNRRCAAEIERGIGGPARRAAAQTSARPASTHPAAQRRRTGGSPRRHARIRPELHQKSPQLRLRPDHSPQDLAHRPRTAALRRHHSGTAHLFRPERKL